MNSVKIFIMKTIMKLLLMVVLGKLKEIVIAIEEFVVAAPGTPFLGGVALRTAATVTRSGRTTSILVFVLCVSPPGLLNSPLLFCPFALFNLASGESKFFFHYHSSLQIAICNIL